MGARTKINAIHFYRIAARPCLSDRFQSWAAGLAMAGEKLPMK